MSQFRRGNWVFAVISGLLTLSSPQSTLASETSISTLNHTVVAQDLSSDALEIDANRLFRQGGQAFQQSQYEDAIDFYQQALSLYVQLGEYKQSRQGETWFNIAVAHRILGIYDEAQAAAEQALQIGNDLESERLIAESLNELGVIAYSRSEFSQALQLYEQALTISQTIGDRDFEARILDNMGVVRRRQGQPEPGLRLHQQAAQIREDVSPSSPLALNLNNIGIAYDELGFYEPALEYNQQALEMSQALGDRLLEARILSSLGVTYSKLASYLAALDLYQQALAINQAIGNLAEAGRTLNNIGAAYADLGEYEQAYDYYQQALAVRIQIGDRIGESATLSSLGLLAASQGQYAEALSFYEQALTLSREIEDLVGESYALSGLGSVAISQGKYTQALENYSATLVLQQQMQDVQGQGRSLNSIGGIYYLLGQLEQALDHYRQALTLQQDLDDRAGMSATLSNIGQIYTQQGRVEEALEQYQQALQIREEIGDPVGVANTLNNIGILYSQSNQLQEAMAAFETVLSLRQELGDRAGEAGILNNIGLLQNASGQPDQALVSYFQALSLFETIGDPVGARLSLSNIGALLAQQGETELAISVYKQSINLTEQIRQDLSELPSDLQRSYVETVADTYRALADLLLQQDRVLEAQRVLDLLRVQELDEYLQDIQRTAEAEAGIANRPPEQEIQSGLETLLDRSITLNRELQELEALPTLTPDQETHYIALAQEAEQLIQSFNEFWRSESVQAQVALLRQTTDGESIDLSNYRDLQQSLADLNQNAALLYPFVLDDRLELVLISHNAETPVRKTEYIDRVRLNEAIANYRSVLENPGSDPLPLAQQLYAWLLEPLEDELQSLNVQTIIYAPDGQLRYIPLSALHDGDRWVVEYYRINNITAASLMDIARLPQQEPRVFAAAFTEGTHVVSVGDRQLTFNGLEFAGQEVENIAELIPGTEPRFNEAFNPGSVRLMNRYSIVHIATHASFVPGDAGQSFLLFGDGTPISLIDVSSWRLPDVELVVLSACETGVGDELGDGREILGLGYQMQKAGADAAIASLWSVNDGGTQVLMNAFYSALNQGMTKAEALRQAQIALISGDLTAVGYPRGDATIEFVSAETGLPSAVSNYLNHPYYWAPFILIGNGL